MAEPDLLTWAGSAQAEEAALLPGRPGDQEARAPPLSVKLPDVFQ